MKAKEIQAAETFFRLFEEGKASEVIELFAEDLQIRNRITSGFDIPFTDYSSITFERLLIYPTPEPNLVLAEYWLKAIEEETGKPYKGEHLAVFKFKDGKIIRFVQFNRNRRTRSLSAAEHFTKPAKH